MNSLMIGDLRTDVRPLQSTDTMLVPVIAVILIGAIALASTTGHSPEAITD